MMKRTIAAILLTFIPSFLCASIFLGHLNTDAYDPDSVNNPYGLYGDPYSALCIYNEYGRYGSPYSDYSVSNPYATRAPRLYDQYGYYLGRFSSNPYDPESIANPYSPYGNVYSAYYVWNLYYTTAIISIYGE
jgi:hypothetical protein